MQDPSALGSPLLKDPAKVAALVSDPAAGLAAIRANGPDYAWQLFLYLNDTVGTQRRWEADFRQTSTIYMPDGSPPAPWGQDSLPPEALAAASQIPAVTGCNAGSAVHNLDPPTTQVDGLVLLDNWRNVVRYQLLMNQPAFDYIVQREFYNVNGQERAASSGQKAQFPATSFEMKTSWIWLGTDPTKCGTLGSTYYVAKAVYRDFDQDGVPRGWVAGYAALAGMHIINKNLPTWVWITFENMKNKDYTQATLTLPIDSETQAANAHYQASLTGSVFANYQLDGVQTEFTQNGQPTLLANSTIETAFQKRSSCITCHDLASIKPDGTYFNIVDSSGGNVTYYIGTPPDVTAKGYTPLDFVWSLKRASRLRQPAVKP